MRVLEYIYIFFAVGAWRSIFRLVWLKNKKISWWWRNASVQWNAQGLSGILIALSFLLNQWRVWWCGFHDLTPWVDPSPGAGAWILVILSDDDDDDTLAISLFSLCKFFLFLFIYFFVFSRFTHCTARHGAAPLSIVGSMPKFDSPSSLSSSSSNAFRARVTYKRRGPTNPTVRPGQASP